MYLAKLRISNFRRLAEITLEFQPGLNIIMLPSNVSDFSNPEIADLIERTQQSPAANSTDRVKFFKLAWDAIGSEFASRHNQYEMFYAGATFVTKGHSFRTFDWAGATGLVDNVLSTYSLDSGRTDAQNSRGELASVS
jgi:4-hydroxyphenylacetate 3-monooxygenase